MLESHWNLKFHPAVCSIMNAGIHLIRMHTKGVRHMTLLHVYPMCKTIGPESMPELYEPKCTVEDFMQV